MLVLMLKLQATHNHPSQPSLPAQEVVDVALLAQRLLSRIKQLRTQALRKYLVQPHPQVHPKVWLCKLPPKPCLMSATALPKLTRIQHRSI